MPTIVLGLDGAHWELLDPWIEDGKLPNLERIRGAGTWGDLQSCLPPVTSPNWKCYSTGKNPGKFGVYWWEIVDVDNREIRSPNSQDYKSAELWDYLARSGFSSAVVNMPTTYPPRTSADFLVSGGPDAEATDYTVPSDLQHRLETELDYRVHPTQSIRSSANTDESTIQAHLDVIASRFDAAEWNLERESVDFLHVTTFYINVLQHYYWDAEPTERAWKLIDERIGNLLDAGHNLLLMSDHGSTSIDWGFNINKWLEEEGYLTLHDDVSGKLDKLGLTRGRLLSVLDTLPIRDAILRYTPESVKNKIPEDDGTFRKSKKNARIDWENSQCIASGQGPIYLLTSESQERSRLAAELSRKLERLHDPDGRKVFDSVYRGEDVYHGSEMGLAPALVVDQNPGYHVPGSLGGDEVFSRPEKWAGENKQMGMFAFVGEGISNSNDAMVGDAALSITDLMPTVLHWLDAPIPSDVDGDVRNEVFEAGSSPESRDPEYTSPIARKDLLEMDEDRSVETRLEDLGYL